MSRYHAKYDKDGNKVLEIIDDEVMIDNRNHDAEKANYFIQADIQPYQAQGIDVATGKAPVIHSRAQHRAYLKRNGYVEVGNEPVKMRNEVRGDFVSEREVGETAYAIMDKYRN